MGCGESKTRKDDVPVLAPLDSLKDHRSAVDDYLQQMQVLDQGQVDVVEAANKKDFDEYYKEHEYKGSLGPKDTKQVNLALVQSHLKARSEHKQTEAEAEQEQAEFGKKVKESQKANTQALWLEFDKNGDGALDKMENRALVKAYLAATQKNFPVIIKFHLGVVTSKQCSLIREYVRCAMKSQGCDGWIANGMMNNYVGNLEKDIHRGMQALIPVVTEKIQATLDQLIKDSEKIADELLEKMDLDHDSQVDRMEFEQCFGDLVLQVFDINAIWNAAVKKPEAEAKARTEAFIKECKVGKQPDLKVGARVEALYENSWNKGKVVLRPEDDESGKGLWKVQCDGDKEGEYTNVFRVRVPLEDGQSTENGIH